MKNAFLEGEQRPHAILLNLLIKAVQLLPLSAATMTAIQFLPIL